MMSDYYKNRPFSAEKMRRDMEAKRLLANANTPEEYYQARIRIARNGGGLGFTEDETTAGTDYLLARLQKDKLGLDKLNTAMTYFNTMSGTRSK